MPRIGSPAPLAGGNRATSGFAERRSATTIVGFGDRPKRSAATIKRWQPYRNPAGTMRGWISVEMPSGIVIHDMKLMIGPNGSFWIAMPGQRQLGPDGTPKLGPDGKPLWSQVIEFSTRAAADRFRDAALEALKLQFPEALDEREP